MKRTGEGTGLSRGDSALSGAETTPEERRRASLTVVRMVGGDEDTRSSREAIREALTVLGLYPSGGES